MGQETAYQGFFYEKLCGFLGDEHIMELITRICSKRLSLEESVDRVEFCCWS
jgi:hypothetical protein